MTELSVQLSNVTKTYGEVTAADDVSFSVEPGGSLALIGPSGCGKTTALRLIAGLERPDSGSVVVDGVTLASEKVWVKPEKRRLGMVFQDWALFPHLSVLENVEFGLSRANRAAGHGKEALEMVQLGDLTSRRIHELSGGQSQRVALARALATRPKVMLFDEAFSSLDAQLTAQVRVEVADLMRSLGIACVYVTHDQAEAFAMADDIAVMRDGALVQVASPVDLYRHPVSAWVAGFVGQSSIIPGMGCGDHATCKLGKVPLCSPLKGECDVLLRPELLKLCGQEPDAEFTIERVQFEGHQTSYQVVADDSILEVTEPGPAQYGTGDRVHVSFTGDSTTAFAA